MNQWFIYQPAASFFVFFRYLIYDPWPLFPSFSSGCVSIRHGVVGNISACHADARGSIPRDGVCCSFSFFCVLGVWPCECIPSSPQRGRTRARRRLGGRAVQGASFRYWSLRRHGFESRPNHFLRYVFRASAQLDFIFLGSVCRYPANTIFVWANRSFQSFVSGRSCSVIGYH